jgi:hypothetical protein
MPADPRTYITVHDGMPENPKIEELSDRSFRVLFRLWCWCSRNLSDGVVTDAVWRKHTTPKVAAELTDGPHGPLAERVQGGYYMHDYLEHQRSRAEVDALREKRSRAGSMGGRAKAERVASATAGATANVKQARSKPVAESDTETEPSPTGEGTSEAAPSDTPRPDVEALCDLLADLIEANGVKRPTVTQRWRDAARLLMDRDEYTAEQVEWIARWATSHEFWRANILSMPTLREKFGQLKLQATAGRSTAGRRSPGEEAAATLALGEQMQAEFNARQIGA